MKVPNDIRLDAENGGLDIEAVRREARDRLKRFQNEIENRLAAADLRGARHKLHKMMQNRSVRLQALILANARVPAPERLDLVDLRGLIDTVKPMTRTASPQASPLRNLMVAVVPHSCSGWRIGPAPS